MPLSFMFTSYIMTVYQYKVEMKKIFITLVFAIGLATSTQAYTIGGAYASLLSYDWGEYGNIGTYEVNGQIYRIFFGDSYCEY